MSLWCSIMNLMHSLTLHGPGQTLGPDLLPYWDRSSEVTDDISDVMVEPWWSCGQPRPYSMESMISSMEPMELWWSKPPGHVSMVCGASMVEPRNIAMEPRKGSMESMESMISSMEPTESW